MIDGARGLFTADMAANLLAAFLLVLALLPYAEPPSADPSPAVAMTVVSERAFVDALHRRAAEGPSSGRSVDIRHARDMSASCGEASDREARILLVLDPELLPALARSACPGFRGARLLIVPAPLKGPDGDWSQAVRRLFTAPLAPEEFRRALLALLQGGNGTDAADRSRPQGALEILRRRWAEIRPWMDFITAGVMLALFFRIRNVHARGAS